MISSLVASSRNPDMAHSNAEFFFLHSEDKSSVKSVLLRHGTYCTLYMRNAQDLLCLAYEQERKTTCMYMAWTATRGMHFSIKCYLLTETRLQIYRYIETRCVAARLYAFEDDSEYTDPYSAFCTYD